MAEMNGNGGHLEPVLAIKLTKAIWVLVFAILWLGYLVTSLEDSVKAVVTERMLEIAEIVDHEMDDTNDNYEASFGLLLKNQCSDAYKKAFENKCESKATIRDLVLKKITPNQSPNEAL
tara:strand:- start:938 stop:1294 length:357 start_codon:yes stop_codon:yes gene_type:complete